MSPRKKGERVETTRSKGDYYIQLDAGKADRASGPPKKGRFSQHGWGVGVFYVNKRLPIKTTGKTG